MNTARDGTPASKQPVQIAGNGSIEPVSLTAYTAGEPIPDWIFKVAERTTTPAGLLSRLAKSCNVQLRMAVADNLTTSVETMMLLAHDQNDDLRFQLAENHNIPESVLKLLSQDSHPYVACRALKTLARLAAGATTFVPAVFDAA